MCSINKYLNEPRSEAALNLGLKGKPLEKKNKKNPRTTFLTREASASGRNTLHESILNVTGKI